VREKERERVCVCICVCVCVCVCAERSPRLEETRLVDLDADISEKKLTAKGRVQAGVEELKKGEQSRSWRLSLVGRCHCPGSGWVGHGLRAGWRRSAATKLEGEGKGVQPVS